MHTAWASGGHPATQPMGAPGRGTPRGGGGVRRGRRRDVIFSRLPAFYSTVQNCIFLRKTIVFPVKIDEFVLKLS